jgi:hypothetical protein
MTNSMPTSALPLCLARLRFSRSVVPEDGGRLAPIAVELVDRLAILVAIHRFLGMGSGSVDSRSLRSNNVFHMQHVVRHYLSPLLFGVLGGMCGDGSCNVFPLFDIVLWVHISATLCSADAVACLPVPRA